ncbi:hypothetical protein BDW67DRAFT_166873 [Aspergillus spinulosporus]
MTLDFNLKTPINLSRYSCRHIFVEQPEKQTTGIQLRLFVTSGPALSLRKAIAFFLSENAFTSAIKKCSLNRLLVLQIVCDIPELSLSNLATDVAPSISIFERITNPLR